MSTNTTTTHVLLCRSCRFWVPRYGRKVLDDIAQPGKCHRRAPTYKDEIQSHFPTTDSTNGCGEWESNPEWVIAKWDWMKANGHEDEAIGS